MQRLKVGIDCDGVLTSAASVMIELINEHPDHDHDLAPAGITGYDWDFYNAYCSPCFRELLVNPEFARRCVLYPGTREALQLMAQHVDLYLMTHRRAEIQPATIEWMQEQKIYNLFTNVWFERKSKVVRAYREGLDIHLDDSPNVIDDWSMPHSIGGPTRDHYPELVIYDCNYNQHLTAFARVKDITEFAQEIVHLATHWQR